MLLNREGRFMARIIDGGIEASGKSNLTCFAARLQIDAEWTGEQWQDVSAEGLQITAFFYLEKKDGGLNSTTIESLKAALGWDGRDAMWLQDTDLSQHPVQITTEWDAFEGKTRMKVRYLDPEHSTGGGAIRKASGSVRNAIINKLGSKLRALAGGTPAPAPMPSDTAVPPKTEANPASLLKQVAWTRFYNTLAKEGHPRDFIETEWNRILIEIFGEGVVAEKLSQEQWKRFSDECDDHILPI